MGEAYATDAATSITPRRYSRAPRVAAATILLAGDSVAPRPRSIENGMLTPAMKRNHG
jgi:hypothetical protein